MVQALSPLPVLLVNFSGENISGINHIEWTTASEINCDYFTVQRSNHGINYVDIGMIKGSGTSHTENYYTFDDKTFQTGLNYYRLRQTDYDGKSWFSSPIQISTANHVLQLIQEGKNLWIKNYSEFPATLRVSDISGRQVYQSTISEEEYLLSKNSLPSGVLFIQLYNRFAVESCKLKILNCK